MAVTAILAPSNLGLRPLHPGREPGTWRAPAALAEAGLLRAIRPVEVVELPRPGYDFEPQPGTRLRNGRTIRGFGLLVADAVAAAVEAGTFPLVVGGDCSILLGALAGVRRHGRVALVHVDGHSDFRHPGNYDFSTKPGAVAGMDLALATGRGEALMTAWPGVEAPLVPDHAVIQLGEREGRDPEYQWPDIASTEICRIDVFDAATMTASALGNRVIGELDRVGWPFWVHFDVDALDQSIMPAVDTPGSPGIDAATLESVLARLFADRRCRGATVTIFDPELDPAGTYARYLVDLLARITAPVRQRV